MWQAFWALLGAAATVAACYAAGALMVDWAKAPLKRPERFPLSFVLGASILHLVVFAMMALKIAYRPLVVAMLAVPIAWAVWKGSWKLQGEAIEPLSRALKIFYGAIFAAFTVYYFFHAWAPESSPDGSSYHLGLVARYLRVHGFEKIITNMYAEPERGRGDAVCSRRSRSASIRRRRWCIMRFWSRWRWRCSLMDAASGSRGWARRERCWFMRVR